MGCTKAFYTLLVLVAAFMLKSCSSVDALRKEMIAEPTTYDYLIKPETQTQNKADIYVYVYLDSLNEAVRTPQQTEKLERKFLHLLLFWKTETTFKAAYDTMGCRTTANAFIQEGFLREARRKANLRFTRSVDSADLFLKLDLVEINGAAIYQKKKEVYVIPFPTGGLTIGKQEGKIRLGSVSSKLHYQLYDRNKHVLLTDILSAECELLKRDEMKIETIDKRSAISLNAAIMEATGDTFRQHFEHIIAAINRLDLTNESITQ